MAAKLATPSPSSKTAKSPSHSVVSSDPDFTPTRGSASLDEVRLGIDNGSSSETPEIIPALDNLRISEPIPKNNCKNIENIPASLSTTKRYYGNSKRKQLQSENSPTTVTSTHACKESIPTSQKQNGSRNDKAPSSKHGADSESEIGAKTKKNNKSKASPSDVAVTSSNRDNEAKWRLLGDVETLRRWKCRRLYAQSGRGEDVALFYRQGKFYAMSAWCSHMGGPLHEGDIEDYKGRLHVMCPWHAYMFDVVDGMSDIGLKQDVFPVKIEDGKVFILYSTDLSLNPYLTL